MAPGLDPLDIVRMRPLMERTRGLPSLTIALIDGPVALGHPALEGARISGVGPTAHVCTQAQSEACVHGTLVAGVLVAARGSGAPAICPDCTLLVRPIFPETAGGGDAPPFTSMDDVANAIVECVNAGARLVNVSAALEAPSCRSDRRILDALEYAARRGAIVVAAAGNQATLGSSALTRHPWVTPVVACDAAGRPIPASNLGHSIARNGAAAPGADIRSLDARGGLLAFSGTSAAAPIVTGALALLWSIFPGATAAELRRSLARDGEVRRTIVPPLLDASRAFDVLSSRQAAGAT
jgi:subtilisin family serine protease